MPKIKRKDWLGHFSTKIELWRCGKLSCGGTSQNLIFLDQVDVYMCEENPENDYLSSVWYPRLSMVWGCFAGDKVGDLKKIEGILRKEFYLDITKQCYSFCTSVISG